ncbi:diguanylate cyclase, partial [Bacillus pumilus]
MRGPEVLALINHVGAQLLPVRKARNPYLCTQNPNSTDMTNSMKDHLPQIEMAKMEALYQIEAQYESGRLTLEEARRQLAERVGRLRPYHLAYMEQN